MTIQAESNKEAADSPPRRAIIYCRVSTEEQAKGGISIEMQMERLQHLAKVHDLVVADTVCDAGVSAKNLNRKGIQKVLELIRDGLISHLLVYKLDRLSRSIKDIGSLIDLFQEKGVALISATESIDTASPMGRMICNILGSFAQFERELIAERTRDAMEQLWKAGRWTTKAPFGYTFDENRRLLPHPEHAPLVRELFERTAEDKLTAREAFQLVTDDSRYRSARKWNKSGAYFVLTSRVYIGEVKRGKKWGPGMHEAIVAKPLFDRVQEQLSSRNNIGQVPRGLSANLLAGIAVCGHCGRKLISRTGRRRGSKKEKQRRTPRYSYYICASEHDRKDCVLAPVPSDVIENAIFSEMASIGRNRELVTAMVRDAERMLETRTKGDRSEIKTARRRLSRLEKKIRGVIDHLSEISPKDARARELSEELDRLSAEKEVVSNRVSEIEAQLFTKRRDRLNVDLLVSLLMYPRLYLPKLNGKDLREVMKGIIHKATVWRRDEIEIEIALPSGAGRGLPPAGGAEACGVMIASNGASQTRTSNIPRMFLNFRAGTKEFRVDTA